MQLRVQEMASASRSLWLPSLTTLILRIYFTSLDLRACRSLRSLELGKSAGGPLNALGCSAIVRTPIAGSWTQLQACLVKWERRA